jgi:hypothetical protein
MAIQVALTAAQTNVGIDCAAAYARIVDVHYNALTGRVDLAVNVYCNRAARDLHKTPVFGGVYSGQWLSNEVTGDQGRGEPVDPAVAALPVITGFNLPAFYTFLSAQPDFTGGANV